MKQNRHFLGGKWNRLLTLSLALLTCSCGGGGGGDSSTATASTNTTSPPTAPITTSSPPTAPITASSPPTAPTTTSLFDVISFGNSASESSHGLTTDFPLVSAVVVPIPSQPSATAASDVLEMGALNQSARRLLPRAPNGDYYGGEMNFTMAVDPVRENNFTLKFWGSDATDSLLVLNVNGLEVGARHFIPNESILLNSSGWFLQRFIYRTVRLPLHLTQGQTSVSIKIRSLGRISSYASGTYDNYQKRMSNPTVPLYRAYMHTTAMPDLSGEAQGVASTATIAGTTAGAETTWLTSWKNAVNTQLSTKLIADPSRLTADDLDYLAQAYRVSWTTAYNHPAVASQIIAAFDAMVSAYSAAPTTYLTQTFADHGNNGGWGGYFGQVGSAINLMWPQLSASMNTTVVYGGTLGTTTRRAAWATALRASIDFGRTHRKTISNQAIDAAQRIYLANAGLLRVDATQALNEAQARRYLYEAFGISPWMGEDQPGGGPIPVRGVAPYGPNWFMTTTRGTTKEDCLVGGDYGEQGSTAVLLGTQIGDATLVEQGLKMLRARRALRYPSVDSNGNLTSYVAEPIGCRNDDQMTRHVVYLSNGASSILVAALGAVTIGNDLVGYVQQQFNEGQLLSQMPAGGSGWMKGYAGWNAIVSVPDAYASFKAQPATGISLPMTSGQPDFAWGDEENMVVAAKHGEERFWANFYWRGAKGINRLVKVFLTTPAKAHIAEVSVDDVRYTPTGSTITVSGSVDDTPPHGKQPLDNPMNANKGLVLAVARRPDLTSTPPTNRDAGRGAAYTLRYGHWFAAINAHPTADYDVPLPADFGNSKDLVSGLTYSGALTLAPKTTAVFYLAN